MKNTFVIKTLGCKVNQYESDGIGAGLEARGWQKAVFENQADLVVVNTCAVTARAGMQSRQAIRRFSKDYPNAVIIATGCHIQTDPSLIRQMTPRPLMVCNADKTRIANRIDQIMARTDPFKFKATDHSGASGFKGFDQVVSGRMTRAYLKIQDGCNAFCSYCIIPHARGASVSMPEHEVMRHLDILGRDGFNEVILTGIHTGLYGHDLTPETTLSALMEKIDQKRPVNRIRLSSIEPIEITDQMIDLAGTNRVLCDHFHIPLQSGDDHVLQQMKRPYTAAQFDHIVGRIHDRLPFCGIGIDVLVGFPGETEDRFENTFNRIKNLPVSYLHIFPFSPRKGTPAWHFKEKVNGAVIKARVSRLQNLDREKRAAFLQTNAGRVLDAVIQHEPDRATGFLKAVTSNYLTLFINPDTICGPPPFRQLRPVVLCPEPDQPYMARLAFND